MHRCPLQPGYLGEKIKQNYEILETTNIESQNKQTNKQTNKQQKMAYQ
jgi:hypothetical protein